MEISLQQVVKIANNRDYSLMTLIYDGTQEWNDNPRSNVYKIGKYCVKYYIRDARDFRTEVKNLNTLERESCSFAPKLWYSDPDGKFIIMEYIEGVSLGKYGTQNLNSNQQKQLSEIKEKLESLKIYYEKEDFDCLVEANGELRFVDYNI